MSSTRHSNKKGMNEMTETTRTCTKCGESKSATEYYPQDRWTCKVCRRADMRRYAEENRTRMREAASSWRARNEGLTYKDEASGYVMYIGYDHPAAAPSGMTREHRIVLWDKLEGQDAPCNWCGKNLVWGDDLKVDHVNGKKDDNDPENLVPSCHRCNITRAHKRRDERPCSVSGCTRPYSAKGFCQTHYQMNRQGRAIVPIQRRLTNDERYQLVADIKSGMTVVDTARKHGVDHSAVSRHFKKITGQSIKDFRMRPGGAE